MVEKMFYSMKIFTVKGVHVVCDGDEIFQGKKLLYAIRL